ncbi:CAP domain-containing protein [Falsochrobactrum sp. TDYN1]|uniref:CAP domain-containing protein n=1 Tax=Falsochrobactrum tianjinense TaxID=2706015 RepID=A0A949PM22_9HYPH|nr:CAP domain-containing protein [Falsochrobactrum sp. TDYN1]MBV2142434.1 CAP domain-containing protein [Falsochrobactrum sp. TDYN1]
MQQDDKFIPSRRSFLTFAGAALAISALPPAFAQAAVEVDPTELFNQIRKAHGLPLMATNSRLEQAALYQARRMAGHGKVSHSVGWGNGFVARLKKAGIRGPAAENVASGQTDTRAVFDAWMNSPGHRKNMLDPIFAHYGLAWATPESNPRYIYWAMMLGL